MKKKKVALLLLCVLLFTCLFAFSASAKTQEELLDELMEASSVDGLLGSVDNETADLLSQLGLDDISLDQLLDISPHKVISLIFDIITGKFSDLLKYAFMLLAILILIALIDTFVDEGQASSAQFNSLYTIFFAVAVSVPLVSCVSNVLSAIKLTTDFTLLLIPIFAGIITAAGSPALALSYHSLTFSAAQVISQATSKYLSVFMGVNLSLCITGAINPLLKTQNIVTSIKRIFTVTLSLCGTLFVGLMSIKGLLAGAADSLTYKSTKFLIGTFIPVIGSSLGEGLASVLGSLSLLNTAVGVIGIIVIALINLPVIIEVLIWWFILNLCAFAAGMLGKDSIANLLSGLSGVIVMLNVLLIFTAFLFILSIGLTLGMRKTG